MCVCVRILCVRMRKCVCVCVCVSHMVAAVACPFCASGSMPWRRTCLVRHRRTHDHPQHGHTSEPHSHTCARARESTTSDHTEHAWACAHEREREAARARAWVVHNTARQRRQHGAEHALGAHRMNGCRRACQACTVHCGRRTGHLATLNLEAGTPHNHAHTGNRHRGPCDAAHTKS